VSATCKHPNLKASIGMFRCPDCSGRFDMDKNGAMLALFWFAEANHNALGKEIEALHAVALGEDYHPCQDCGAWHNPRKVKGSLFYAPGASICADCLMRILCSEDDDLPWAPLEASDAEGDRITALMLRWLLFNHPKSAAFKVAKENWPSLWEGVREVML
jgi:hypothetical protein